MFLTFGIALYTVLNAENITSDMAGASLALALQISVLYQMFLRLCLEVNSRMSSAESIMKYAGQGFLDNDRPVCELWSR